MKKLLIIGLSFLSLFCFGCENKKIMDSSNKKETVRKDLAYFKENIRKIVPLVNEVNILYEQIGASYGFKMVNDQKALKLEIYSFDINADTYKKILNEQKLCSSDNNCSSAIVNNGYVMMIDDNFPNREEVIDLFNDLNNNI